MAACASAEAARRESSDRICASRFSAAFTRRTVGQFDLTPFVTQRIQLFAQLAPARQLAGHLLFLPTRKPLTQFEERPLETVLLRLLLVTHGSPAFEFAQTLGLICAKLQLMLLAQRADLSEERGGVGPARLRAAMTGLPQQHAATRRLATLPSFTVRSRLEVQ